MLALHRKPSRLGFVGASLVGIAGSLVADLRPIAASDAASTNAAILDRYVAAFNAHDLDAFATAIAADFVEHNGRGGQGLTGLQATFGSNFRTWPDFHTEVQDRIFSGDRVVSRNLMSATHTEPVQLPGTPVYPPTGKRLSWVAINIWRARDGKFVEHWDVNDFITLIQQLRTG